MKKPEIGQTVCVLLIAIGGSEDWSSDPIIGEDEFYIYTSCDIEPLNKIPKSLFNHHKTEWSVDCWWIVYPHPEGGYYGC